MEKQKKPYEYKDEMVRKLQKYNPIIHENKDNIDEACTIEIKNRNSHSLFIDLEEEFIISYGPWHDHYYCEDREDYEAALEKVLNVLNNKDCILVFYSNNKLFGSGTSLNKNKYTKEETIEFLKSFFPNEFPIFLKEYGAKIEIKYWDENKNYEIFIDKEKFMV